MKHNILHPVKVSLLLENEGAKVLDLLHGVVEDSDYTLDNVSSQCAWRSDSSIAFSEFQRFSYWYKHTRQA